jgi:hypothetical protein
VSMLQQALESFQAHPEDISRFAEALRPELIEEALNATGTATVRRRKLPAEQVIWMLVGMAMFANCSIEQVVERLQLSMGGVVRSTPSHARYRIGPEPLAWLFRRLAAAWSQSRPEDMWKGLALYGLDGTHLRVPDSAANFAHFGKPGSSKSVAGYPQLRMVALMNLSTRQLAGAAVGPWSKGEVTLARELWCSVPDNSLTIIDRGFQSYMHFFQLLAEGTNRHFLGRAKSNTRYEITERLPDGSALALLHPSSAVKKSEPGIPGPIEVRVIEYCIPGGKPSILLTSLLDHVRFPAGELVLLYHERWEVEVAFDELKTDLLDRGEALRSRKPEGVEQEVWAILLTYNLIRREMALTGYACNVEPRRMSFRSSMFIIRDFFIGARWVSPGNLPKVLREMRDDLRRHVLPPRRRQRRYPRHVKIKMSNYPRNRGKRQEEAQDA